MDYTVRLWNAEAGECVQVFRGHIKCIQCVAELKDGRIVSGSQDKTIRIWDRVTGDCQQIFNTTHMFKTFLVLDINRIVIGTTERNGTKNTMDIWNLTTGVVDTQIPSNMRCNSITKLSDTQIVIAGRDDADGGTELIRILNTDSGVCEQVLNCPLEVGVYSVIVTRCEKIVTCGGEAVIRVFG
jgi:WD40 repeat protein